MRKTKEVRMGWLAVMAAVTIFLVMMMGLLMDRFSIVSRADGKGTVTASAATIRKETDVNSAALGSIPKGKVIDIKSEVKDASGTVWYEVYVDSKTTGYIRGDLIQLSGSVPSGEAPSTTPAAPTDTPVMNPTVEVTALEPLSATITGSDTVRVRADASTDGAIIVTVQSGMAVTVNGQATGTDGKVWYQVGFTADGGEVAGFVRSDYLTLAGEPVPAGQGEPQEGGSQGGEPQEPAAPTKEYDTQQQNGVWYLLDYNAGEQYDITQLIGAAKTNYENYQESLGTIKGQKIAIIILVVLLVLAILAATLLFFKIRDVMDEAYFSAVEKETLRERGAGRASGGKAQGASSRKVMQTVGGEETKGSQAVRGTRPASGKGQAMTQRPAASSKASGVAQGRPAGAGQGQSRSAGAGSGQPRSAGAGQGQSRPAGAGSGQSRSAGAGQGQSRPVGAGSGQSRPAGAGQGQSRPVGAGQGQSRPAGAGSGQGRPAGAGAGQARQGSASSGSGQPRQAAPSSGQTRPSGQAGPSDNAQARQPGRPGSQPAAARKGAAQQDPAWKSKNFMSEDDDEFEFEFLNWDEDDNQ